MDIQADMVNFTDPDMSAGESIEYGEQGYSSKNSKKLRETGYTINPFNGHFPGIRTNNTSV